MCDDDVPRTYYVPKFSKKPIAKTSFIITTNIGSVCRICVCDNIFFLKKTANLCFFISFIQQMLTLSFILYSLQHGKNLKIRGYRKKIKVFVIIV